MPNWDVLMNLSTLCHSWSSNRTLMLRMKSLFRNISVLLFWFTLVLAGCSTTPGSDVYEADIVIVGGGASGVPAAIQAARMGADVLVIEETKWLGGMLTAAGVSATDGNHQMPSGLWGEFRQKLYDHYGGPEEVFTGWVSNTLFEPQVGDRIFKEMVSAENGIHVLHGYRIETANVDNGRLTEIELFGKKGGEIRVRARQFIDATEYGDLLARAGAAYSIYMETYEETMEKGAPEEPHPYVQDMTYVAILQDFGEGEDHTIAEPAGYDPSEFECICLEVCTEPTAGLLECDRVLDYGRLPNDKFMINWPNKGNDYYADNLELSYEERDELNEKAKDFTRSWIYFMQTEGGYTNLGYARDEFPTEDYFPLKPYIRESRRVEGVDRFYLYDILEPYQFEERPIYKTGIAVADYPVDHHRKKNPEPKQIEFPAIPSYNIPFGTLIPETLDGLIVAEKSISVTNVVNGTTRLQPAVMQIGQAAGAAAALSVQQSIEPRELDVRTLQKELLNAGMWLMPYMDTDSGEINFKAIQRIGLSGIMRGEGIPVAWANETRFYPLNTIRSNTFNQILTRLGIENIDDTNDQVVTRLMAIEVLGEAAGDRPGNGEISPFSDVDNEMVTWFFNKGWLDGWIDGDEFFPDEPLRRGELAFLIDRVLDPFSKDRVEIGFPNPMLE